MAITLADFTKIWASTSPLTPYSFSDANYQEGWNFVGSTPPARQMWDSIQKQNDEKAKFIVDNYMQKSTLLWNDSSGKDVGDTFTLDVDSSNYNSFVLFVCADLSDSSGSAIGIFATRMNYQMTSNRVRGQNGTDFAGSSATNYDWRTVCVDVTLNGTSATVNSCCLVRNNNGTMSKTVRKLYAIYGFTI